MIKRILVALDLDSDTPVATRYAVEIAKRHKARVTGLAVVDMGSIDSTAIGGGIGSMYYAEKLREKLTDEARDKARELTGKFDEICRDVDHIELVEEGVPFERIVEDMKFHDLLVVGDDPHFFYNHPDSRTDTLVHVVEHTIGPTLVVKKKYRDVHKVLVAYDGTDESARALRRFLILQPFGNDLDLVFLNVHKGDNDESMFRLGMARSYAEAYGFEPEIVSMEDHNPEKAILSHAKAIDADLIIIGVHIKRGLTGKKLGKTTSFMLEHSEVPVFMDH